VPSTKQGHRLASVLLAAREILGEVGAAAHGTVVQDGAVDVGTALAMGGVGNNGDHGGTHRVAVHVGRAAAVAAAKFGCVGSVAVVVVDAAGVVAADVVFVVVA